MHLQLTSNTVELNRSQYLRKKSKKTIYWCKHSSALNLLKTEAGWWDSLANKSICQAKPMTWKPQQNDRINFWKVSFDLYICAIVCVHVCFYANTQKIYKIKNILFTFIYIFFVLLYFFFESGFLWIMWKIFISHHKLKWPPLKLLQWIYHDTETYLRSNDSNTIL